MRSDELIVSPDPSLIVSIASRRGRCALNKCYKRAGLGGSALSYGTSTRYGTSYLIILLFGCGFLAWDSFWFFLLQTAPEVDGFSRYCTIRVRASIIRNTVEYRIV